ncbi:MAG TPA: glycosyltransferase family 39 protein [Actinocatenispora sp.]
MDTDRAGGANRDGGWPESEHRRGIRRPERSVGSARPVAHRSGDPDRALLDEPPRDDDADRPAYRDAEDTDVLHLDLDERDAPVSSAPSSSAPIVGTAMVAGGFRGTNRALTQLAWLGSALLTAVITIFRADRPGLWADELATWGMTTVPGHSMWGLLRSTDMVNGPYYVFMWGWTHLLGRSDLALRLPSVIAMTVAAALVAALGSRFCGPRAGLVAGLLFAILPAVSRYGQEARVYALVVCFAAASTLLLARALDRPRFTRFLPYVLVVAVMGLLNVVSLVLLVAHGLLVLVLRRRALAGWVPSVLVGAAPAVVLLALSMGQRGQVGWIAPSSITALAAFPYQLFGATAIGGALLVLSVLAVSYRHPAVVYTTWAVLPAVVLFVAGHYTSVWLPRYLLFTLPAWVLLAAMTLDRIPLVRGLVVVAAVALVGIPAQGTVRGQAGHDQDTRGLATIIANNELPGDGVVYGTDDPGGGWVGRDTVAHYLAADARPKDIMLTQAQRTNDKVLAVECTDATKCLPTTVNRVWVVRLGAVSDPLRNLGGSKEEALRAQFQTSRTWHPAGLTLALLTRKPS